MKVYLLEIPGGWFKIGQSLRPERRLAVISTASPHLVTLRHTIATAHGNALERALHAKFKAARGNGEWFQLTPEDVAWVESLNEDEVLAVCKRFYPPMMPKEVKVRPPRKSCMKAFHAPVELFDVLDQYVADSKPKVTDAAVLRYALETFLEKAGFWPPKEN